MIVIQTRQICLLLLVIAVALAFISLALQLFFLSTGSHLGGLVYLMDVDQEQNVPTWFSSISHFLVFMAFAAITALTKNANRPYVYHWAALALLFGIFSLDEVACIHDQLPVKLFPELSTFWRWIFPGSIFVIVVSLTFIPFMKALPRKTMRGLLLGWFVFFLAHLLSNTPRGLWPMKFQSTAPFTTF